MTTNGSILGIKATNSEGETFTLTRDHDGTFLLIMSVKDSDDEVDRDNEPLMINVSMNIPFDDMYEVFKWLRFKQQMG